MESIVTLGSRSSLFKVSPPTYSLTPPTTTSRKNYSHLRVNASSTPNSLMNKLKNTAATIVLGAATISMVSKFQQLPARAESLQTLLTKEEEEEEDSSLLTEFVESNSQGIEALKTLVQQKLEAGEDEQSLEILKKLVLAQPDNTEWKFLMARLLNEMGQAQQARTLFEDILRKNPLSFEALLENALLMDRCGEGEAVFTRLERALRIAEDENKAKEARDVRLIMAQIHFLQKNVEEALRTYEELGREDPNDFRPYFCKGVIYSLLDRNDEATHQFAKYHQLSPNKFEVEGYLRTPLSRIHLFRSSDSDVNRNNNN